MDDKDFGDMIGIARRAPLANMDEAEAVARLLQKFAKFAKDYIEERKASTDENQ